MLSKQDQLYKNKATKDLTDQEKDKYFSWIKDNKKCVVCGKFPLIHHVTHKSIKGHRRRHFRVLAICHDHHSAQSSTLSIHNDTYRFYKEIMSLEKVLEESENMYNEFKAQL
jgi:hypothetical protein